MTKWIQRRARAFCFKIFKDLFWNLDSITRNIFIVINIQYLQRVFYSLLSLIKHRICVKKIIPRRDRASGSKISGSIGWFIAKPVSKPTDLAQWINKYIVPHLNNRTRKISTVAYNFFWFTNRLFQVFAMIFEIIFNFFSSDQFYKTEQAPSLNG